MAEDITKITNHAAAAVDRLSGQYKDRPRIAALLTALATQVQDIEDAAGDYVDNKAVATADGHTLDLLAEIVGAEREGFEDDFLRVLINVKVGENRSEGDYASIVNAFKLLTSGSSCHYQNLGFGSIMLGSDGAPPVLERKFLYEQLERIIAGGVSVDHIIFWDTDEPFAFAGGPTGAGFSDITGTTGGKLASSFKKP